MSTPDSYSTVIYSEYKRYMGALEEASDNICGRSLSGEEDEDSSHLEHLDRTRTIHQVTKVLSAMTWENYIMNDIGEMLTLYEVDTHGGRHKLVPRKAKERSNLETYTASLRDITHGLRNSYLLQVIMPTFGLEAVRKRAIIVADMLAQVLRYLESVASWLERYMTWIEHGSQLAAAYVNAAKMEAEEDYDDDDDDEEEEEEEDEEDEEDEDSDDDVEPSDFYQDPRIRAYAMLKTTDFNPDRLVSFISDIDSLIYYLGAMVDLLHKLYASMKIKDFEAIFNALVNEKGKAPRYEETEFENIHELNEYLRQRVNASLEEPQGFMYNVNELLEEARYGFASKLASEISEDLAFIPSTPLQKRFVAQFESGLLWRHVSRAE
jgi:hypothetical protein